MARSAHGATAGSGTDAGRAAILHLDGWEGRTRQRVTVIGATAKRYRIRALERTRLAGPRRWLAPGETALVPKYAITFEEAARG